MFQQKVFRVFLSFTFFATKKLSGGLKSYDQELHAIEQLVMKAALVYWLRGGCENKRLDCIAADMNGVRPMYRIYIYLLRPVFPVYCLQDNPTFTGTVCLTLECSIPSASQYYIRNPGALEGTSCGVQKV